MRRAIANGQLATVQNKERSVCRLAGQGLTIQTQGYTDTIDRCTAFQLQTALGQVVMTAVHEGRSVPFDPADILSIPFMGMIGGKYCSLIEQLVLSCVKEDLISLSSHKSSCITRDRGLSEIAVKLIHGNRYLRMFAQLSFNG